jgi:hypothetical protein
VAGFSRWLPRILEHIHDLAVERRLRLTAKADCEMTSLGAGLELADVREVLLGLTVVDSAGRLVSRTSGEWMYVFKPQVGGVIVYLKMILRGECVVVSFHEDEGGENGEDENPR